MAADRAAGHVVCRRNRFVSVSCISAKACTVQTANPARPREFRSRNNCPPIFSEPVIEAAVTPESREILLCHDFLQELPDGYKVVVRSVDSRESTVSVRFLRLPDVEECREISEGITAVTGLPVRLVMRRRMVDGTVQETPWIPKPRSARSYFAVLVMLTPFIGGIAVGRFMPHPSAIVGAGLLLWIGQMLLVRASGNQSGTRPKFPTLYELSTIFTFGASYAFAYVVAAYMFRVH